jgi:hypothetical protein
MTDSRQGKQSCCRFYGLTQSVDAPCVAGPEDATNRATADAMVVVETYQVPALVGNRLQTAEVFEADAARRHCGKHVKTTTVGVRGHT